MLSARDSESLRDFFLKWLGWSFETLRVWDGVRTMLRGNLAWCLRAAGHGRWTMLVPGWYWMGSLGLDVDGNFALGRNMDKFYKLQNRVASVYGLCGYVCILYPIIYVEMVYVAWITYQIRNSSPPRWKNGRNTWRVSQSPRTGTGNLLGVAGYLVGCHDEITRSSPQKIFQLGLLAEGHVWPWACSKWTAFWEGQPHQVEIQSQAHQLRMGRRNWFILWILIPSGLAKKGLKLRELCEKKSSMLWVWASSFRCLQKSYSKLKRV